MGKLEEMSDGLFILEVTVGGLHVYKVFEESDKSPEEVSDTPKTDGFYLDIPDR